MSMTEQEPDADEETELVTGYKPVLDESDIPGDVAALMSKTFDRRRLIRLLRDTHFFGPIHVGSGGWRGAIAGAGQPGTGLRRPSGALHSCPRSWRFSILKKALMTGLVGELGESGRFATTERGAALLDHLARCPVCGSSMEPVIRKDVHVGNPNTEGSVTNTSLTLRCPDEESHETDEEPEGLVFDISPGGTSHTPYERDEETRETIREMIEDHEDLRVFGDGREVEPEAAWSAPETDVEAIEERLDELIEDQKDPREPYRMQYPGDPGVGQVTGRPVVAIGSSGEYLRYKGTDEAISVSRTDEKGDIHISNVVSREESLKVQTHMDYETAVEAGAKDDVKSLHYEVATPEWNGSASAWEINLDTLAYSVDILLRDSETFVNPEEGDLEGENVTSRHKHHGNAVATVMRGSEWTVTVDPDVVEEMIEEAGTIIMGMSPDGTLID